MATGDLGDVGAWREALGDNLRLQFIRPAPSALDPAQNFHTPRR